MRKKLLAGVMALALCSTNMPPRLYLRGNLLPGHWKKYQKQNLLKYLPMILSTHRKQYLTKISPYLIQKKYRNLMMRSV